MHIIRQARLRPGASLEDLPRPPSEGSGDSRLIRGKALIFWDPKLIDAHILLGKIFLERGDRGEARKYALSAIAIDPNNQEAIALQRQVTMGN